MNADGTIDDSSGITQAQVTKPGTGFYCIGGLNPAPEAATASLRPGPGSTFGWIFADVSDGACTDNQVGIFTYNDSNVATDNKFTVVVY